jgi:predicted DNA-binding ArsR family transcriptional regulator
MNKINIVPEDIYEFYLEVADNDFSGYKKARTHTLKVRLPSLAEVSREADMSQKQVSKELDNIKKEAEQVKKSIEELERDLMKNPKQKELD